MDIHNGHSDSFGQYSFLAPDSRIKQLRMSASAYCSEDGPSDYCFLAFLGLAQRLRVELLPLTWEEQRGLVGRGGQARVVQSLLGLQTSLAFKCFDHHIGKNSIQEMVQEMTLLAHSSIRHHQYIIQLEGISWDITAKDEVWPVLVFEKSRLGDLNDFIESERGMSLSSGETLSICADIGIAIRDMHANDIIHGDIKPQNILIFEEDPGQFIAKVADFGFSTWFHRGERQSILMPISLPWTAPENQRQKFGTLGAKRLDVYSFGMVCLWLILRVKTESLTNAPFNPRATAAQTDDGFLQLAQRLVAKDPRFTTSSKRKLTDFFGMSLSTDSQKRTSDWASLLGLLVPDRKLPRTEIIASEMMRKEENFQVASSVAALYRADFRVRCFIAAQFEAILATTTLPNFKNTSRARVAEQLALCYQVGFGVPRNEEQAQRILVENCPSIEIEDQVQLLKDSRSQFFEYTGLLQRLDQQGVNTFVDLPHHYREKNLGLRAIKAHRRELRDAKEVFGENHEITMQLTSHLVAILKDHDEFNQAEELVRQFIRKCIEFKGDKHPYTLTGMSHLASIHTYQGRFEDAAKIQEQIIETRSKEYGDENAPLINDMTGLSTTYHSQGRWEEAEKMYIQTIEKGSRFLGDEHRATLICIGNLASVYAEQRQWEKAEELFSKVIEIGSQVFVKENPSILNCMGNLAVVLSKRGRLKEAEERVIKVVKIKKEILGDEHSDTLAGMGNLATIYYGQGRLEEAEELERQVLEISSRIFGAEHPDTLSCMSNLASSLQSQNKLEESIALANMCYQTRKRVLGSDHPDTLTSMNNLACSLADQGKTEEAMELGRKCFQAQERLLGPEHPTTLLIMSNLAGPLYDSGQKEDALSLMRACYQAQKRVIGPAHQDTKDSLEVLNAIEQEMGRRKSGAQAASATISGND